MLGEIENQGCYAEDLRIENVGKGRRIEGLIFTGHGRSLLRRIGQATGLESGVILDHILNRLLVQKGVDWTGTIANEYLNLYDESLGTFCLVWDNLSGKFVSHGAVFQSRTHPGVGLVAHIRTLDDFKYLGLGTLVTERVTQAAFDRGARVVVLATDDKLNRVESGEKAAHRMYSRIGYVILGEKRLADTVDWLMIIDAGIYDARQEEKRLRDGRFPEKIGPSIRKKQDDLIRDVRCRFESGSPGLRIDKATNGDLAGLFLLTALCPETDFRVKIDAWDVHQGPELERAFVVNIRPAMMDRDRLEEGAHVLRDEDGFIVTVCAARRVQPFHRNTYRMDVYGSPGLIANRRREVEELIAHTVETLRRDESLPDPCYLTFSGIDEAKIDLFRESGFQTTGNRTTFYSDDGGSEYTLEEYARLL